MIVDINVSKEEEGRNKRNLRWFSSHGRDRGRNSRWISVDHGCRGPSAVQELEVRAGTGFPTVEGELQRHSDQGAEGRVVGNQRGAHEMQF